MILQERDEGLWVRTDLKTADMWWDSRCHSCFDRQCFGHQSWRNIMSVRRGRFCKESDESRMSQPIPQFPEEESHAASEKDNQVQASTWETWVTCKLGTTKCGRDGFLIANCQPYHKISINYEYRYVLFKEKKRIKVRIRNKYYLWVHISLYLLWYFISPTLLSFVNNIIIFALTQKHLITLDFITTV